MGPLWCAMTLRRREPANLGLVEIALTRAQMVEMTGFEPVTPSLRLMRSKPSDQGKRHGGPGLWGGCGASDGRRS